MRFTRPHARSHSSRREQEDAGHWLVILAPIPPLPRPPHPPLRLSTSLPSHHHCHPLLLSLFCFVVVSEASEPSSHRQQRQDQVYWWLRFVLWADSLRLQRRSGARSGSTRVPPPRRRRSRGRSSSRRPSAEAAAAQPPPSSPYPAAASSCPAPSPPPPTAPPRTFKLESNSELQVTLNPAPQGAMAEINLEETNTSGSRILHWRALRPDRREWLLPSQRPDGTSVYKNKALRTPFVKSGDNSTLRIVIEDHAVQAIEFLVFDEAQNKWFENNDQNFLIQLQTSRNQGQDAYGATASATVVPEDLVQIQSYLRWERIGKQSYTLDQEKWSTKQKKHEQS